VPYHQNSRGDVILVSKVPGKRMNRSSDNSRLELSAFLKSRRARLAPEQVGLAGGSRRRTPGLRREEVAQLAAISVTWYTWLEQGREIQASTPSLERIARVLRLNAAERTHLFALAHRAAPPVSAPPPVLTPALRRMLDSQLNPSYLKTARWDVLAWSPALVAVFGDLADVPAHERNMLWLVFTRPDYRLMMPDWATDARAMVAKFRLEFGRHHQDPEFKTLVENLSQRSAEFRRWWPEQDVLGASEGTKRFHHQRVGEIHFEHTTFVLEDTLDLRFVVYTPLPGESAKKVAQLGRSRART